MQVQGREAPDVLRGMVYAPSPWLFLRGQRGMCQTTEQRRDTGSKQAFLANAQSKVLLVNSGKISLNGYWRKPKIGRRTESGWRGIQI